MPGNRKAAEDFILTHIEEMCPGSDNTKLYKTLFTSMNDDQFDQFMQDLDTGKKQLAITSPNFSSAQLDTGRNIEIAERLGHKFFQRIQIPAVGNKPSYMTPNPYLVVDLPLRRQAQLLDKKIKVPVDNNSVDDFTGQPTGKSKGSRISHPEVQVISALGQPRSLEEFLKYRGGDEKGFNAMNTVIQRTGGVSMDAIEPYSGQVRATTTLKTYLTAMMLSNTL